MPEAMPGDMMFSDTRPGGRHGRRQRNPLTALAVALVLVLSVGLLAWWWRFGAGAQRPAPRLPATATTSAPPTVGPAPVVPAIRHPVEIARTGPLPTLHEADRFVASALDDLLGRSAARAGVVTDGFLQRFVPVKLSAPWRHYEFVDPQLEALSAGQKLMVRIGPDNERRVKAVLTRARTALVGRAGGGEAGNANSGPAPHR